MTDRGWKGINPYIYAPADPALDAVDTLYRANIGYSRNLAPWFRVTE